MREGILLFLKKVVAKTRILLDNSMCVSRTVKGGSMNLDLWHFLRSSESNAGQVCVCAEGISPAGGIASDRRVVPDREGR